MSINSVRQKGRPRLASNVNDPRVSIAVRQSTHRTLMQLKRKLQKDQGVCANELTFDDVIVYLLNKK